MNTTTKAALREIDPALPIVLLDLNYTLVGNSEQKLRPFDRQIEEEEYRLWLIDLINTHYVILMTARPFKYVQPTLKSIITKCGGWFPDEHYFNTHNERPPDTKRRALREYVFPKHGEESNFLAIESNPKTRKMYAEFGIPCIWVDPKAEPWETLPKPE